VPYSVPVSSAYVLFPPNRSASPFATVYPILENIGFAGKRSDSY
jgi:hypothetical protein